MFTGWNYVYRVEFQARGSPHIHWLFWIKDTPQFKDDADEKGMHSLINIYHA